MTPQFQQLSRELDRAPRIGQRMPREFGADLAPQFALIVEGTEVTGDLTRLVKSATFESATDMADCLTLELLNPGFALTNIPDLPPDLVSHKAFQPGNEVEIWGGYGEADTLIGRAILAKHLPRYPGGGVPTLQVKGYDKSFLLMNMEGFAAGGKATRVCEADWRRVKRPTRRATTEIPPARPDLTKKIAGRSFRGMWPHDIVKLVAQERWGLEVDIDPVSSTKPPIPDDGIIQPRGMNDYELIKTLANIHDRDFWIDYAPTNVPGPQQDRTMMEWILHWKEPVRTGQPMYRFVYGDGDRSTLLSIDFEYGLRDSITEINVLAWDEASGSWVSVVEIDEAMGPSPIWYPGGGTAARATQGELRGETTEEEDDGGWGGQATQGTTDADALITETLKHSTRFRMAAAGVAIDVVADRPFKSLDEAQEFARGWFQKRKDSFIIARGRTVGVEKLTHRQIHKIEGVGPRLSGDYQFSSVKHRFDSSGGHLPYTCDFVANRIIQ